MKNPSSTEANQDNEGPPSQERAEIRITDSFSTLRYLRYLLLNPLPVPLSFPLFASVDLVDRPWISMVSVPPFCYRKSVPENRRLALRSES